jgi:hypothetical protein
MGEKNEKLLSHISRYDIAFTSEIAPYHILPFAGGMFPVILTEHYISRFLSGGPGFIIRSADRSL